MARGALTSDKMPFVVMLFGFPAGVLLTFAAVVTYLSVENLRALDRGAPETAIECTPTTPVVCTPYAVRERVAERLGTAALLAGAALLLWTTGFRYRWVWLDAKGRVVITWGKFLPVPLRHYPARELSSFAITKELRYTVSPRAGSAPRVGRAPDRWRLRAKVGKRTVNLGSYVSEQAAEEAQRVLRQL